ncbi:ArdC-like ssDNA-binding domain-containing protein [Rosenbergiella nectarea]|uniref:ArdC-like ssDNA-binding domain-containing protein n=1 Tax=Rosenbergiella nectarea TaxID=988801 RepID=UPI001F4DD8A8|nr:ArdC-like ssDNA-binding domain-containing protein [Rosenbergiella nectarea]
MANKPTKQQAYNDSVVESLKFLITNSDQSWRKEWASDGYRQQGYKGNEYKNTNQLVLFKQAYQNNYTDPRWMTFNQVVENGYKLEKGSKASTVLFYTNTKRELNRDENGKPRLDENGNKTYKTVRLDRPVAVSYNVFNATKIDGIEPFSLKQSENQNTQPLMSASDIIKLDEGIRNRNDSVDLFNLGQEQIKTLRDELQNDIKKLDEEIKATKLNIDAERLNQLISNHLSSPFIYDIGTDFGENATPYRIESENSDEIRLVKDYLMDDNPNDPAQVTINLYPLSTNEAHEVAEILNTHNPKDLYNALNQIQSINNTQQRDTQRISDTAFTLAEIGENATQRGTAARFTIDNLPTDFDHFVMGGDEKRSSIHAVGQSGEVSKVLTGLNEFQTKEVYTELADINPADIREFATHQASFKRDDVMTPAQFAEFAQERKHEAINEVKELYPSLDLDAIRAIQDQDNVRFLHNDSGELFALTDDNNHSLGLTSASIVEWDKGAEIISDLHANNELGALIEAYQPITGEYLERERPLSAYVETKEGITIEAEPEIFEAIKAVPDNWGGEIAKMGERTLVNVIDENGGMQFTELKTESNGIDFDRLNGLLNELDNEDLNKLKTNIAEKEEEQERKRPKVEEYQSAGLDLAEQRLLHNLYQWLKSDDGYEIQRQDANVQETIGTVQTQAEAIDITDWLNNFNGLPQAEKNEVIAQLEQKQEQALLGFNGGDIALTNSDNPSAPKLPDYAKIDYDVAAYIENHGLRLQQMASERAFFSNGGNSNVVVVPLKEQFGDNQDAYYATLFHELIHSTKLLENSRQGFETDLPTGNEFGSQNYAREELVAEVGALLLCQHYGINSFVDPDNEKISDLTQNSAAYLKNWIEAGDLNDSDISKAVTEAKRSTNAITGQNLLIANKIEQSEKQEVKQIDGMQV